MTFLKLTFTVFVKSINGMNATVEINPTVITERIGEYSPRARTVNLFTRETPIEKIRHSPHLKSAFVSIPTYLFSIIRFIVIESVWKAPKATK